MSSIFAAFSVICGSELVVEVSEIWQVLVVDFNCLGLDLLEFVRTLSKRVSGEDPSIFSLKKTTCESKARMDYGVSLIISIENVVGSPKWLEF